MNFVRKVKKMNKEPLKSAAEAALHEAVAIFPEIKEDVDFSNEGESGENLQFSVCSAIYTDKAMTSISKLEALQILTDIGLGLSRSGVYEIGHDGNCWCLSSLGEHTQNASISLELSEGKLKAVISVDEFVGINNVDSGKAKGASTLKSEFQKAANNVALDYKWIRDIAKKIK